jgi:hypothetical protein
MSDPVARQEPASCRSPIEKEPLFGIAPSDRVAAGLCALVIVLCAVVIATFSFGRDQSIYAVVGRGILHGQVPYRDLWDFKPPGIFFVFALGEWLFGRSMSAPRILEALGLILACLAMVSLGRRWFDSALAGLVGGAVAAIAHLELDFWHSGQPETFGGMLTLFALWAAEQGSRRRLPLVGDLVAGALLGASGLLKPPLGGVVVVLLAHRIRELPSEARWPRRLGIVATMALGAALPVLGCGVWFWARGGVGAMVWTLRDFVPGYSRLGWSSDSQPLEMLYYAMVEAVTRFSPLIAVGLVCQALLLPRASREKEGAFLLLGCACVQLAGVALQAKFFQYHYGATVPVLALLSGAGLAKLWNRARVRGALGQMGLLVTVAVLLLMRKPVNDVPLRVTERAWVRLRFLFGVAPYADRATMDAELHRAADYDLGADRRVASWIASHTAPTESVLVWGFEPAIYWLSERRPATRFIYDVPQRSPWQTAVSQSLMLREVVASRPAVVVVQHNDVFPAVTGKASDSYADLRFFPSLGRLLEEKYQFVETIEDFDLLVRLPENPPL